MQNILSYLKKYKNKSFYEIEFNEIDNVIFSSISYSEFKEIIPENKNFIYLNDALIKFVNKYTIKQASKLGFAQKDSYKIIKEVINSKRYRDVVVYGYRYISDKNMQFCAMTYKVKGLFTYVAFEGTDHLLSGWKEDFEMVYIFPVSAHKEAIKYLNEMVGIFDKNLMIGGHSKGGNLALVASMYCHPIIRHKIKRIYSNDGQGLRKAQIESKEYKKIENKLIQILPNYSIVGLLLRHNNNLTIIKSSRRDILAHAVLTWEVEDKAFKRTKLSNISKKLDISMIEWLDKNDDSKRKKMITTIFKALEDVGIENLYDIKSVKNAIKVIKSLSKIDKETKDIVFDFLSFNLTYVLSKNKGDE